ncbi:MAG: GIY-YIG nuclease family protein [Dehalococcoidales bacterium]|nr:GIY-YIG nuclease family protein [Dehalococcoidales bacterium]
MADVYLLHFERPYWGKARHYVGYTKFTAAERIDTHRAGNGSKLVAYAMAHGNNFECVLTEHFDSPQEARARELQLKKRHGLNKLCPRCKGEQ